MKYPIRWYTCGVLHKVHVHQYQIFHLLVYFQFVKFVLSVNFYPKNWTFYLIIIIPKHIFVEKKLNTKLWKKSFWIISSILLLNIFVWKIVKTVK